MEQAVADAGFVDMPTLGVVDIETFIAAMTISAIDQRLVKLYNIVHQTIPKFYDIGFLFLADYKFFPC